MAGFGACAHIFETYTHKGERHRTEQVYNDAEFDHIMAQLEWRMPYWMRAYHFSWNRYLDEDYLLVPKTSLNVAALVASQPVQKQVVNAQGRYYILYKRQGNHALVHNHDNYLRHLYIHPKRDTVSKEQYSIIPLSFSVAKDFTNMHHRHNSAPQGHKFSIGLMLGPALAGCVIASIPKAPARNDGKTLEINRVTALPGQQNACSRLMGRAIQAGRAMGYTHFISYTLPEEGGASLKASGFHITGKTAPSPNGWDTPKRPRKKALLYPEEEKLVWEKFTN